MSALSRDPGGGECALARAAPEDGASTPVAAITEIEDALIAIQAGAVRLCAATLHSEIGDTYRGPITAAPGDCLPRVRPGTPGA
ncbi:hypothetical protein GCM10011610_67360 [Nocardia rhizosphaerihabitans]|uniref:Uncharacterized protein n=1 Tax=Nocardia rhizosphaerihabitans TaxID=1691570 RepID=A0ABQ2L3I4_9NOCA|nr:hypothetical protein GCM10011610_67360 [Nocardia rhizosphaerihabitans]